MKKMFLFLTCFTSLSLMMTACKQPEQQTTVKTADSAMDMGKVKAAIQAVNAGVSTKFMAKDSAGMAANYTADAVMMPPNMAEVAGTNAILHLWGGFMGMGFKDLTLTAGDTWQAGNTVVETGTWSLKDQKDAVADHGKYLVLWKEVDGQWKIYRDIWNSDMPMPMPAAKK